MAAKLVVIAVTVCALGLSAMLLRGRVGQLPVAWPANAVIVALLIRSRRQSWPHILAAAFVGDLVANVLISSLVSQSILLSGLNSVEIFICSASMFWLTDGDVDLSRPRDLRAFAILAAVGAPLLPAFLAGNYLAALHGGTALPPFLSCD